MLSDVSTIVLAVNLFELLIFFFNCIVGVFTAMWGFDQFGWFGAAAGFVIGFLAGFVTLYAMCYSIDTLIEFITGKHRRPRCPCGECVEESVYLLGPDTKFITFILEFKCGRRFLWDRKALYPLNEQANSPKILSDILVILRTVENSLPKENVRDASELLEHDEWGVAFSLICTQIYEYDVPISEATFSLIESVGQQMRLPPKEWTMLSELVY